MCDTCNQADVKSGCQSGGTRLGGASYAIRDYVTSGKIGDVYYGRMTSFCVRDRPDVDIMLDSPWFIDSAKIGSGACCDTGAYDIDKTLCLLGDPQPAIVSATAFRGIDMPAGNKVDIDCCNYNWVE